MIDPQGVLEEFVAAASLGREHFGMRVGFSYTAKCRVRPHVPRQNGYAQPVRCSNGERYTSIKEAGRELGISYKAIERVLAGRKPSERATRGLSFQWL